MHRARLALLNAPARERMPLLLACHRPGRACAIWVQQCGAEAGCESRVESRVLEVTFHSDSDLLLGMVKQPPALILSSHLQNENMM